MLKIVDSLIRKHTIYDSFYIVNMSKLHNKIREWRTELPMVKPFYAIKCNPNEEILKTMINEGLGFDVASKSEIDKMLRLGADLDNLIYAHPVKSVSDINHANNQNIRLTTFDSLSELNKLSNVSSNNMNCLLRLKVDNPTAKIQLGLKYGAERDEYKTLIDTAKDLNINIVGTSIHVGSASKDPFVFANGINYCREVFDYAIKRGFLPNILDIGGGFSKETFKDCAIVIRDSIKINKFNNQDIKIISEPGRHLVEEVFDFYTPVVGIRTRNNRDEYYIGDSLYGSFNSIIHDLQVPEYEIHRNPLSEMDVYINDVDKFDSMIWCSTCDSLDKLGVIKIPKLRVGDFIKVRNFGAYTISGATDFNGINLTRPHLFYIR